MRLNNLRNKKWYPNAVAACIAVTLFVVLTHLGSISKALRTVTGYFSPVFLGLVLAYLINPLARMYQRTLFRRIRRQGVRWSLSIALAVLTVMIFLIYFAGTLVPQLVDSATGFIGNLDDYAASLQKRLEGWEPAESLGLNKLLASYEDGVNILVNYLNDNLTSILNLSLAAGKSIFNWVIALFISFYVLGAKEKLQAGVSRLLRATVSEARYDGILRFFSHCNLILNRYIIYSLLDSMIVGIANAVFMQLMGMQYVGLVSIVVAVMNLIPTFGPFVGGVIGGLVLLLVNPLHALIFLIFTLLLQTLDGYVIKPRLFGKSLGISGLMIIAAIVVGGKIMGVVGILLAVPLAAILDYLYTDYLLPALEKRRKQEK